MLFMRTREFRTCGTENETLVPNVMVCHSSRGRAKVRISRNVALEKTQEDSRPAIRTSAIMVCVFMREPVAANVLLHAPQNLDVNAGVRGGECFVYATCTALYPHPDTSCAPPSHAIRSLMPFPAEPFFRGRLFGGMANAETLAVHGDDWRPADVAGAPHPFTGAFDARPKSSHATQPDSGRRARSRSRVRRNRAALFPVARRRGHRGSACRRFDGRRVGRGSFRRR